MIRGALSIFITLSVVFVSGCKSQPEQGVNEFSDADYMSPKVIYGDDDRRDLWEVSNADYLVMADSTVALIKPESLVEGDDGFVKIKGRNFGDYYGLCQSEPFREQMTAAFCSGSLVGKDLVLTAGHCVQDEFDCERVRFAFGFGISVRGAEPTKIASSEIYRCSEIVHRELESSGSDFAVIKLDREVVGHEPLEIRRDGEIGVGEKLLVIGHPAGLPIKVADNAWAREIDDAEYFVTNLDTYGGNSGSAVFNAVTGVVEGILVRGETDFRREGSCYVSNRCTDSGCRGEDVTRVSMAMGFIPELGGGGGGGGGSTDPSIFSVEPDLAIPDHDFEGVSSSLYADTLPGERSVYVEVDLTHTWRGDLTLTLVAPDGKQVLLHSRQGSYRHDIIGTYGIDLAPIDSLESLSSVSIEGDWVLKIADHYWHDIGILNKWSLIFE